MKSQTEQVFYYNTKLEWSLTKDQVRITRVEKFKVWSECKSNSKERYRTEHLEEIISSNSKGKKREDRLLIMNKSLGQRNYFKTESHMNKGNTSKTSLLTRQNEAFEGSTILEEILRRLDRIEGRQKEVESPQRS